MYSKETATAIAKKSREKYGANIGIGVTGTMGNVDPENESVSVPGQVYFAIDFNGDINDYYVEIPWQKSRLMYKLAVAGEVCDVLLGMID